MVNQLLQNIIQHAYKTVPYYKRILNEYGIDPLSIKTQDDLVRLPVLLKEQIQEDPDSFISSDYLYFPKNRDIVIRRTSGSTGKFLKIYWSRQDDIRSMFHLWQIRKKLYGINPSDKFCAFHTTIYSNNRFTESPDIMLSWGGRNLSFNKLKMNEENILKYYLEMTKFNPVWLIVQPSIANLLSEFLMQNNLTMPQSLRYIELTGEYLQSYQRDKFNEEFGIKAVNQYGCNEANSIAIECPNGNLHCLGNNAIIEILKDGKRVNDGEEGEIHITCLTNTAMPFIRYALGDRGIICLTKCNCGNDNKIIKLLSGRVNDYILLKNGQKLNSYIFLYPIEIINSQMGNPINQFQIIQTETNKFIVYLTLKKSFSDWKDVIKKEFQEACLKIGFSNVEWRFEFIDFISLDKLSGKLQFFINNINKANINF